MKNYEAILTQKKKLEIQEADISEPNKEEIQIEVEYVGMCGSDIHGFEFGPFIPPKDPNQKIGLGHEISGKVIKLGGEVTEFQIGDKVIIEPGIPDEECEYCQQGKYNICPNVDFMATQPNYKGGLTKYINHSAKWTYHIPKNMTTLEGALVEPAAVGMHAVKLADVKETSKVVIFGAGTIGLMTLQAAKYRGVNDVIVVDIDPKRLELAEKLGASKTIDNSKGNLIEILKDKQLLTGHGADIIFEAAGIDQTLKEALEIVSRGGKIILVGTQPKPVDIDFLKINREVLLQTSFRYANDFEETIEAISSGKFNVEDMITNIYSFDQVQEAFIDAITPGIKNNMIKSVIKVID